MRRGILKKGMLFILCMALIFTQIQTDGKAEVNAAVMPAENLLTNGDFSDGLTGWNTYFQGNSATAKVNSDYEMNMTIHWWEQVSYDNNQTFVKINWQAMLMQSVSLSAGKQYTVQFDAYASEPRSITSVIKEHNGWGGNFNLTTEKSTYKYTFDCNQDLSDIELQFLLGYVENGDYPVPEGKNDVYLSNVFLVEGDGSNIVITPGITGVDEGAEYIVPVTPGVNYSREYHVTLQYKADENGTFETMEGFQIGDVITENGFYKLIVSDADDSEISVIREFSIDTTKIDYSKDYYLIKSRSNGKVLEASGFAEDAPIIQSMYAKRTSQLFSMEDAGNGNIYIRSMTSGKVIGVQNNSNADGAKLVQQTADAQNNVQKWTKVSAAQGYISLKNVGTGKVIDVPSASSSEGIQMTQYTSNNSNAQQWDIIKTDVKEIVQDEILPDTSTEATWKVNAIIAPEENKLTAAGPIYLQWYNNKAMGEVEKYEIQFDNEETVTVAATDEAIMEYEWYNTSVSKHTVVVAAVLKDGNKIVSDTRTFFVSKKGIGWGSLYRTDDMNLSWYYQWSMEESVGTDEGLQFVPMVWGNWGSEWLNNPENQKYKTVLGFNEPDFNEQSALTVEQALEAWGDFSNSGLRVGSPCTAIGAYWSKDWFWKFMDGVDADENLKVDFIAIHCYMDNGDADAFLKLIDDTWNQWHKPIWVTEFGVAKWGANDSSAIWNNWTTNANYKVYQFMKKVLPELDKRSYVERYAWFPFDPNDKWGGSSGIFNYDTGVLNELGKLYANSGNPEGYQAVTYTMNPPKEDSTSGIETPEEEPATKPSETTTVPSTTASKTTVKKPAKAVIKKAVSSKKKVKLTIRKQIKAKGYEVVWSKTKKFKKSKKVYVKNKKTITINRFKKVKKGTIYYFRIRAYKIVKGKRVFGIYSKVKKVII